MFFPERLLKINKLFKTLTALSLVFLPGVFNIKKNLFFKIETNRKFIKKIGLL